MSGNPDNEPPEVEMMYAIRKYGALAVMGRALGAGEIRRFAYIERAIAEHNRSREEQ